MSTEIVQQQVSTEVMQTVLLTGDLSALNPQQKMEYYTAFCQRLGLDPVTKPFQILKTDGKETLYPDRSCTAQLTKINKVTHKILSREVIDDMYVVTAQASRPDGQATESIGAVPLYKEDGEWQTGQNGKKYFKGNGKKLSLIGDARANALMKAETKAKRRATLDLLGLGLPDESEISGIPGATTQDIEHVDLDKKPAASLLAAQSQQAEAKHTVTDGLIDKACAKITEMSTGEGVIDDNITAIKEYAQKYRDQFALTPAQLDKLNARETSTLNELAAVSAGV